MIDKNEKNFLIFSQESLTQAGNVVAALASNLVENNLNNISIVVLVGQAIKGRVGLTAAYNLWQAGAWVQILCSVPTELLEATMAESLYALRTIGVPFAWAEEGWELPPCDLLIDAIVDGAPVDDEEFNILPGRERELILLANSSSAPILSIQAPSGVDANSGRCFSPHITAIATVMLGLPKPGLLLQSIQPVCGALYLADIGISAALYRAHGFSSPPVFNDKGWRRLEIGD